MSRRSAAKVSVVEPGLHARRVEVALVLAAHVVRWIGWWDRPEHRHHAVLERCRVAAGRCLHRAGGDHLQHVVDHHVAQRADRVVEVAAILDPELLGHRDLDGLDVVAVPDRLEHRVGEAQEQQLDQAHLAQEVVDPVELRLVDVGVQLVGQRARRLQVVAERLLDDHPRVGGEAGLGQALDDLAEQERRDLQVEDRVLGAFDCVRHPAVGGGVAEVALDVGEPLGQPREHLRIDLLSGALDALPRVVAQVLDRPVVDGHADDRAVQEPPPLEPVERPEGHHLRQIAGDAEHDEHVRRLLLVVTAGRGAPVRSRCTRRHAGVSSFTCGGMLSAPRVGCPWCQR